MHCFDYGTVWKVSFPGRRQSFLANICNAGASVWWEVYLVWNLVQLVSCGRLHPIGYYPTHFPKTCRKIHWPGRRTSLLLRVKYQYRWDLWPISNHTCHPFCRLVSGFWVFQCNNVLGVFRCDHFRFSQCMFMFLNLFIPRFCYNHRDHFLSEFEQYMVSTDLSFCFEPFK